MEQNKLDEVQEINISENKHINKKSKLIVLGTVATIVVGSLCVVGFKYLNKFELKKDSIKVELGASYSKNISDYVAATSNVLGLAKMDTSKVDISKVGEYEVAITYKNKKLDLKVIVEDTVRPVIATNENLKVIVGKVLAGNEIVTEISDLAEIKELSFSAGQVTIENDTPNELISTIGLQFDTVGEQKVTLAATDQNGNMGSKEIIVTVIEDYEVRVAGIQNLTLEQGSTIDWLAGITKDEKIPEIRVNTEGVDINTPGEYKVIYTIVGDDGATTIDKEITVTVVEPIKAQEIANSGGTVKTTSGIKPQAKAPSATSSRNSGSSSSGSSSSGSSSSGSSSSGGNSSGSSSSGSSSSGSSSSGSSSSGSSSSGSSGMNPGDKWEGNETDNGYIGGGSEESGGNTGSSGSWNPWG